MIRIRCVIIGCSFLSPFLYAERPISSVSIEGLARHELYWEYQDVWPDLDQYARAYYQLSSRLSRAYIVSSGYTSVLDVPCGVGTEYFGYYAEKRDIEYCGIDITPRFVIFAQNHGAPHVRQGNIEKIPYPDNNFDVVFSRYILEHLRYYKKALKELVRVAKKEVIVIFGLMPGQAEDKIDYSMQEKTALFNNRYNKKNLEEFIMTIPRVSSFQWEILANTLPEGDEGILHIYVN